MIPSVCPDCRSNDVKQVFENEWRITYQCQNEKCSLRINVAKGEDDEPVKLLRFPYYKNDWQDATKDEIKIMGDEVVIFS